MSMSFSCPECNKILKTANPIPVGRKVKCPACGVLFEPVIKSTASAVTSKPPVKAPARRSAPPPMDDDEGNEDPRRRPMRHDADEEDDRPKRRAPRMEEDDDDRPRKRKARPIRDDDDLDDAPRPRKKKSKNKSGSNMVLVLGLSGLGVLLIAFAVTAFVWPGFMNAKDAGGGPGPRGDGAVTLDDLLAFAPANPDAVIGGSMAQLKSKKALMDTLVAAMKRQSQAINDPAFYDLFLQAELGVVVSADRKNSFSAIFAVAFNAPMEVEKMRAAMKAGQPKTVGNRTIYPNPINASEFVAMPTNRILVFCTGMREDEFLKILEGNWKLPAEMAAFAKSCANKPGWGYLSLKGLARQNAAKVDPMLEAMIPGLTVAMPAVLRSSAVTVDLDVSRGWKVNVNLNCANEADASQLEKFVGDSWNGPVQGLFGMAAMAPGPEGAALSALTKELSNSFKVQKRGAKLSVTAEISEKALDDLAKLANKQAPNPKGKGGFDGKLPPKKGGNPGINPGGGGIRPIDAMEPIGGVLRNRSAQDANKSRTLLWRRVK